jgi:hypothetical protein
MKHIDLNWRKTGPGQYEETTYGFVICGDSRRAQILDPDGKEIYLAKFGRQEALDFFKPIPSHPGDLVTVIEHYEWESTNGWMLKDSRRLAKSEHERHGAPDILILPPISVPQAIRGEFFFSYDSIKNAWFGIVDVHHPRLVEKYSCVNCARPALDHKLCPVCRWLEQDYHKTLYTQ